MSSSERRSIDRHYGGLDLSTRILDRLRQAGKDPNALSRDDLVGFDEFHSGGRASTLELGRLAALRPGTSVLDMGSGIGGPARTLAAEFGCRVVGLDLTGQFCRAAHMLTSLVRLSDRVVFQQGDALRMPYRDRAFDVVWSQNAIMNVENKAALFREVARVLRPGGLFALQAAFAGPGGEVHYPTFWASDERLNFLAPPAEARALLSAAGLREVAWEDRTGEMIEAARKRRGAPLPSEPSALGRDVLVATDVEAKIENSLRNYEEGRSVSVRTLWRRPEAPT
jgi:SAM-dependent methyltransferase